MSPSSLLYDVRAFNSHRATTAIRACTDAVGSLCPLGSCDAGDRILDGDVATAAIIATTDACSPFASCGLYGTAFHHDVAAGDIISTSDACAIAVVVAGSESS